MNRFRLVKSTLMPLTAGSLLWALLLCVSYGQSPPKPWKPITGKVPTGVSVYSLTLEQPLRAWMVVTDLKKSGLDFRPLVSTEKDGKESVSSLASKAGAVVAVNASYFKLKGNPCEIVGWFVLDGKRLSRASSFQMHRDVKFTVARSALIWTRAGLLRTAWVREHEGKVVELSRPIPNKDLEPARGERARGTGRSVGEVKHAVAAGPMLIKNGDMRVTNDEEMLFAGRDDRHPRTVVGLRGSKLYLMVIDGRQKGVSRGSTLLQAARLMSEWGVSNAMNLDGGGSSTLVVGGRLINLPLGRKYQRSVPTALALIPRKK